MSSELSDPYQHKWPTSRFTETHKSASDLVVDGTKTPEEIVEEIVEWVLNERTSDKGGFWQTLSTLVSGSEIVIDRPKGSTHPRYSDFIYPLDYGYLKGTTAMDGGGIDVWRGSKFTGVDAIMCIVDLVKRDSEIKVLIGCTEEEEMIIYRAHNRTDFMKGILIQRPLKP